MHTLQKNNYGDEAVKKGIHKIIDFDGAVMTDSGGYQVLEYGDVKVLPSEMANFEKEILTDFAIPLDKPTGFGLPLKKAEAYVKHTLKVSKQTLDDSEDNGQIWIGPIQGGEHFELVAKSTKRLVDIGFKMLALGSPVEFMESYEYRLLAQMIVAAKKQMPHSIPLHLFGACIGVCPTKSIFWMRPMNYTAGQPVPLHKNGVFIKGWAEDAAL